MKVRATLPPEEISSALDAQGRSPRLEPGKVIKIAPDAVVTFEGRVVGKILSAVVDPLGESIETVFDVEDLPGLVDAGFPYSIAPLSIEDRLAAILEEAPEGIPGMGPGKWIVYSARCCWWTTDVRDSVHSKRGGPPIPLCPTCGSRLFQAPAADFVAQSIAKPEHFGPRGLEAFLDAFRTPCHPSWLLYTPTTPEA